MIVGARTPKGLSWAGRLAVLGLAALVLPLAPGWAQNKNKNQTADVADRLREAIQIQIQNKLADLQTKALEGPARIVCPARRG